MSKRHPTCPECNSKNVALIFGEGNEIMIETLFDIDVVYPILKYTDCNCKWGKRTCL